MSGKKNDYAIANIEGRDLRRLILKKEKHDVYVSIFCTIEMLHATGKEVKQSRGEVLGTTRKLLTLSCGV